MPAPFFIGGSSRFSGFEYDFDGVDILARFAVMDSLDIVARRVDQEGRIVTRMIFPLTRRAIVYPARSQPGGMERVATFSDQTAVRTAELIAAARPVDVSKLADPTVPLGMSLA